MNARWSASMLALTLAQGGYAVQQTRPRHLQFGGDVLEMLGQLLGTFKLADGSEGVLRQLSVEFSIMLQRHWKVLGIRPAQCVKLLCAE